MGFIFKVVLTKATEVSKAQKTRKEPERLEKEQKKEVRPDKFEGVVSVILRKSRREKNDQTAHVADKSRMRTEHGSVDSVKTTRAQQGKNQ